MLYFAWLGFKYQNQNSYYLALLFIPATILVFAVFLGLEWLDLHYTRFLLTQDTLSRQQYGRINRSIHRSQVTAIQETDDGLMVWAGWRYLTVPDGLVGEDGVSCDIRPRLFEWLPEESTGAS